MEKYNEGMQSLYDTFHSNPEFKADLLANPIPTIEALTGKPYTGDYHVVVEDQTDPNTVYLNIPANPEDGRELTMDELDSIAGGGLFYDIGYAIGQGLRELGEYIGEIGGIHMYPAPH